MSNVQHGTTDYRSDDVMQFEIRGQDELLSLLSQTLAEIRKTNALLEAVASKKAKVSTVAPKTETKRVEAENVEKRYGRGFEKLNRTDVMKRYRRGESMLSISKLYGCSATAIWKIVKEGLDE